MYTNTLQSHRNDTICLFTCIAEEIFEKKIIENGYFYMRVNERYINCDTK